MRSIRIFRHYMRPSLLALAAVELPVLWLSFYLSNQLSWWIGSDAILFGRGIVVALVMQLSMAAMGLYEVASSERTKFWLGAGRGLVRHGGDSYGSYGSPTSLAGTVGIGSNIRVRGRVSAALGLTTYLYFLEVIDSRNTLQRGFQVDPLVQAGLVWVW